jgi:hypothetical protein
MENVSNHLKENATEIHTHAIEKDVSVVSSPLARLPKP